MVFVFLFLTLFCVTDSRFIHLTTTDSDTFFISIILCSEIYFAINVAAPAFFCLVLPESLFLSFYFSIRVELTLEQQWGAPVLALHICDSATWSLTNL